MSWEEFCTALSKGGLAPSPQDIRALFIEMDKDGNGDISYDEFIGVLKQIHSIAFDFEEDTHPGLLSHLHALGSAISIDGKT